MPLSRNIQKISRFVKLLLWNNCQTYLKSRFCYTRNIEFVHKLHKRKYSANKENEKTNEIFYHLISTTFCTFTVSSWHWTVIPFRLCIFALRTMDWFPLHTILRYFKNIIEWAEKVSFGINQSIFTFQIILYKIEEQRAPGIRSHLHINSSILIVYTSFEFYYQRYQVKVRIIGTNPLKDTIYRKMKYILNNAVYNILVFLLLLKPIPNTGNYWNPWKIRRNLMYNKFTIILL